MINKIEDLLLCRKAFISVDIALDKARKSLSDEFRKTYKKEFEERFPNLEMFYGDDYDSHFMAGLTCYNKPGESYPSDLMNYKLEVVITNFCVRYDECDYHYKGLLKVYNISKENSNKFYWNENPVLWKKTSKMSAAKMRTHLVELEKLFVDTIGDVSFSDLNNFADKFNKDHFGGRQVLKYRFKEPELDAEDEDEEEDN